MKNVFIVYYHPEVCSFNHAMFDTACKSFEERGFELKISDLKSMNFPSLPGRDAYRTVREPRFFKQQLEEILASEKNSFAPFIENEIKKMEWCDIMIWQFPLWWFGLPSPLKGWVERVFVMGRVYRGSNLYQTGRFRGKTALLSLTTGSPEEVYRADGMNGDLHTILRPIQHGMLEFVGFDVLAPNVVYAPAHLNDDERREALDKWDERLRHIETEKKISAMP